MNTKSKISWQVREVYLSTLRWKCDIYCMKVDNVHKIYIEGLCGKFSIYYLRSSGSDEL